MKQAFEHRVPLVRHANGKSTTAWRAVIDPLESRVLLSTAQIYLTGLQLYSAGSNSSGKVGTLEYEYTTNSSSPIADIERVSVSQGSASKDNAISFPLKLGANTFSFSNLPGELFAPGAFEGLNLFLSGSSQSYNPNTTAGVAGNLSVVASTTSATFKIIAAGTPVLSYTSLGTQPVPFFTTPANGHTSFGAGTLSATVTALKILNGGPSGTITITVKQLASVTVTAPAAQTATATVSKSFTLGSFTESNATGPYTATIVWGDGTANTTIKLTAAGTIPSTAHTFATSGSKTVSITVTDSAGHTSNKATFAVTVKAVVASASITGEVFNDGNGDGKLDGGEFGMGSWIVYIDLKNAGSFVTGDPTSTTNVFGDWSFTGLAAGTYVIRVEPVTGTVATTPAVLTIKLTAGEASTGNRFGEKAIA